MIRMACILGVALCGLALVALPALSDEARTWANGLSHIRLQPSKQPGAVAEVEFRNETVHVDAVETFALSISGFSVDVEATVGQGMAPDRFMVTPPEGYIAVLGFVDVPEGQTRIITIYSLEGVGA